jgi:hypothetical protein
MNNAVLVRWREKAKANNTAAFDSMQATSE